MIYLYHQVPQQMEGNILYPLNTLKSTHPDLYAKIVKKYEGREDVMTRQVVSLDCLWNDVLHFTAVHPRELSAALTEAGIPHPHMTFYQIDPVLLDTAHTTVYLFNHGDTYEGMKMENFTLYDPETVGEYAQLPERTKEYYKEMGAQGKRVLMFRFVPHILYKGTVDVTRLEMVAT